MKTLGGATLDNSYVAGKVKIEDGSRIVVPGIYQQICSYLSDKYKDSRPLENEESTMFIINGGSNDITSMFLPEYYKIVVERVIDNFAKSLTECIELLIKDAGCRNIIISNSMSHDKQPFIREIVEKDTTKKTMLEEMRRTSIQMNCACDNALFDLSAKHSLNMIRYDYFGLVEKVFSSPEGFGIDPADGFDPALKWGARFNTFSEGEVEVLLKSAEKKFFWDSSHISHKIHRLVYEDLIKNYLDA
ncbi:hypothetical protein AYI70_g3901 [Smittium culicis]|uniref:GDSL esterase/lipase n=1 Tax=Smittium culicis TaxID=133412 RepID=A0A1R1Y230_9FUNG|nr:hypothetical protein AYI70_g3901 [Smittium culicis]